MRLLFCGLVMGLVGCQHTHLRHNTVHQAKTLAEIYEQQVLDNLAKTVHDAHALPYFAYPKDGSTNISQEANIAATPFNNFTNVFGINGKRSGLEQWGLTPVSDPAKLQLMQCAYQRAVYGRPMSDCTDCCSNEKRFEGKPDLKLRVYDMSANVPLLNPKTGSCYNVSSAETGLEYVDEKGNQYTVDETGHVEIQQLDCNGSCAISCGWLGHGKRCDVPADCCGLTGFHCGTYVWVPHCHRQHLTRLTLKVLDYAVNDPPASLKRQKEVKVSVDRYGQFTTDEAKKVGTVKAIIAIDDPISSVLVVDHCAIGRAETIGREKSAGEVRQLLELFGLEEESLNLLVERWTNGTLDLSREDVKQALGPFKITDDSKDSLIESWSQGPLNMSVETPKPDDKSEMAKAIRVLKAFRTLKAIDTNRKSAIDEAPNAPSAQPSPYVIPKRPTFNAADSYLNPFRIQRDLNALGN